jgi:antitoxin ParD1/3/4/toxin ParE1/3/4
MRRLADMPGMGHLCKDLADESLRFWAVYSYLILYRPDTSPLQVIRVLHGARDVETILESDQRD